MAGDEKKKKKRVAVACLTAGSDESPEEDSHHCYCQNPNHRFFSEHIFEQLQCSGSKQWTSSIQLQAAVQKH